MVMNVQSLRVGVALDGPICSLTEGGLATTRLGLWLAERVGARVQFKLPEP